MLSKTQGCLRILVANVLVAQIHSGLWRDFQAVKKFQIAAVEFGPDFGFHQMDPMVLEG
jgi:hypothetical protein